MNNLLCLFLIFSTLSCDTTEEFFLYDDSDPEYQYLKEMAIQKCVNDANVFDALDLAGDFENADQVGRIYKISQDTLISVDTYVKITSASATEMILEFNSDNNLYDKILTFEKVDHNLILSELKVMACNDLYEEHFSASGLGSNDSMTLTWVKETVTIEDDDDEDDIDEAYTKRTDKYTFDNDYPLFFFFYNAVKTGVKKNNNEDERSPVTINITITEVTDDEGCDEYGNDDLTRSNFNNNFRSCALEVVLEKYKTNEYIDEILDLSGDDDCALIPSAVL
jgi:hypothetical protein